MPYFQFIRTGNIFTAIPKTGCRLNRGKINNRCYDKNYPTYNVVELAILLFHWENLKNVGRKYEISINGLTSPTGRFVKKCEWISEWIFRKRCERIFLFLPSLARGWLTRGVIGNTSDFGSEESRFETWRVNGNRESEYALRVYSDFLFAHSPAPAKPLYFITFMYGWAKSKRIFYRLKYGSFQFFPAKILQSQNLLKKRTFRHCEPILRKILMVRPKVCLFAQSQFSFAINLFSLLLIHPFFSSRFPYQLFRPRRHLPNHLTLSLCLWITQTIE